MTILKCFGAITSNSFDMHHIMNIANIGRAEYIYLALTSSDPCTPTKASMASAMMTAANKSISADIIPVYSPSISLLSTFAVHLTLFSSLNTLICIITNFEIMYTATSTKTINRIIGSNPAKYALSMYFTYDMNLFAANPARFFVA